MVAANDIIMNTDKNNNPNSSNHMKDNDVALVVGNDEESKTITMTTTMVTVHTMLRNATSFEDLEVYPEDFKG